MTKKILCIMLCVALVLPSCIVPVGALEEYVPVVTDGYILNEEFNDAATANFTTSGSTKTPVVENGYVKVDASTDAGVTDLNAPDIASFTADKYTVEFTVRKSGDTYTAGEKDYTIGFGICRAKNANDAAFKKFGLVMPFGDLDNGVTRTYKFTVDETAASTMAAFSNVSVQDGDAAAQTLTRSTKWEAGHWQEEKYSNYIGVASSGFSIRTVSGASTAHRGLVLHVENVKIYEPNAVFANSVEFNGGITEIPDSGDVTPVFDMVNLGDDFSAIAITAIYDKNGNMTGSNTSSVTVTTGEINGAAVAASDVPESGRIEAMLWTVGSNVIPLTPTTVLGAADTISSSTATSLTYSTYANTITIEDKRTANERVAVTVKDASSNALAYTQFDAKNDGSFKKTIAVEPASGSEVSVEVSSAKETIPEVISSIAMPSNWDAMKTAFDALDSTSVESFFTTYEDNFSYYDGSSVTTDLDLGTWDTEKEDVIEFLLSTKDLTDVTCSDIVREMTAVGNSVFTDSDSTLDDVEDFVTAVQEAVDTEDAAALKSCLTNAEVKKWINFVTEDVANLDKICTNLLTTTGDYKLLATDGIEEIYEKFNDAKAAQVAAEAAALADFKAISSEAELVDYFENDAHRENLNITETYSAKELAIMYDVYVAKGYGPSLADSAVVGAITYLQNYIDEYNTWVAAVESKGTLTEKWQEVSKVFGEAAGSTALAYVTPEVADEYIFADAANEPAIYNVVTSVGYSSLTEINTALNGAGGSDKLDDIVEMITPRSAYTIKDGFKYSFDFATANTNFVSQSTGAPFEVTSDNTGSYWRLSATGLGRYYSGASASLWLGALLNSTNEVLDIISPNSTINLDVRYVEKGMPIILNIAKDSTLYNANGTSEARLGLSVALFPRETGKWYTYKITLGDFNISTSAMSNMKIYVKERGEADSKYTELTGAINISGGNNLVWNVPSDPNNMDNYDYGTQIGWGGISGANMNIGYSTYKHQHASWTDEVIQGTVTDIANFSVHLTDTAIADSAKFTVGGSEITSLPTSGTVVPVFNAHTTCKPSATAVSVTAIYDKNGNMTDLTTKNVQIDYGRNNSIEGAGVDASTVPEGGRIEAMLWNNETEMKPLINSLVLGTADSIGTSTAESLTYSTYANTIIIEGKEAANKAVTVKVVDAGDNVLAYTQFNAAADGSFKKTVTVNPTTGSQVTVHVSTAEKTTPDTLTVPMPSNWAGMKTDFLAINKDNAAIFFSDYAANFTYKDNTGATQNIIDVSGLSADDKQMIGFLASTFTSLYNANSEITDIINKLEEIAENLAETNASTDGTFMNEFKTLHQLPGEERETAVAGIKALITSADTKKFIYFDPTGFLNMDEVCETLFDSTAPNIETDIEVLYAQYDAARDYQASQEEAIVPSFKTVTSGAELQSFFNSNAATLGISERIAGYTLEDYNVMYAVYDYNDYDLLEDYSTVNPALVFLMNYIDEYKPWTALVDSADTATEEWDVLKQIFGASANATALTYVTPTLVDAYDGYEEDSVESKIYKRIKDIDSDYTELVDLADALAGDGTLKDEIALMMTCIDDTHAGANDSYGNGKGYWGWIKPEVEEAVEEGWITIKGGTPSKSDTVYSKMTSKTYKYLSDIKKYYDSAVGGTGGGGGGGGAANGSDDKVVAGNGAEKDGITDNFEIGSKDNTDNVINTEGHPVAPFTDITSEYSWAKEKITTLREFGILKGDGDGKFRPGASISREEFLSILLGVFEIELTETNANFTDVKRGEWYNDVIATACKMGIVKGYPDGSFGVGNEVLRADMAVMIVRALDIMGVDIATEEKGFVFKDYTDIPDYAYNAVVKLQQAGLVQGDDYGKYHPLDKLTRAESAVALHSIFKQLSSMYFYSWNSELYSGSYGNW